MKIFVTQKLVVSCLVWLSFICLPLTAPRPLCAQSSDAQNTRTPISIAILDFGGDTTAVEISDYIARSILHKTLPMQLVNRDLARAAARGAGYAGSLNLTRDEARDIGRAVGCDFFLAGRGETLRRSSSTNASYYETYAGIFLVSTRTGQLAMFDFIRAEAASATEAAEKFRRPLAESLQRLRVAALRAHEDEAITAARVAAKAEADEALAVIEDATENPDGNTEQTLRPPQPYRRVRPTYTEQAMRAGIEAIVDVAVEIKADGAAGKIEIERWAGFGLDEAVTTAIRQAHFRPAMRRTTGEAVPMRVLLRYNFRSPVPAKEAAQ